MRMTGSRAAFLTAREPAGLRILRFFRRPFAGVSRSRHVRIRAERRVFVASARLGATTGGDQAAEDQQRQSARLRNVDAGIAEVAEAAVVRAENVVFS